MNNWLLKCTIKGRRSEEFPFCLPLFQNDIEIEFDKPITIICGENGCGKSTVLESLASNLGFSIYGGGSDHVLMQVHIPQGDRHHGYSFNDGVLEKQAELTDDVTLADSMKLVWSQKTKKGFFLRAEHLQDTIANTTARDTIHTTSHGEGLMGFVKIYCKGDGVYIFDEPETALSPIKQLELLVYITEQVKNTRSQYIIATHSPILMALPNSSLLYIEHDRLNKACFQDTMHFQLYKRFVTQPTEFINKLLSD